jgi:TRAP-type mannitol/chloroaromatic compound transport system substrate-binding protein
MQGAWGAKDIFNEMAEEYVKRVNEMAGGRLRIDYLVGGAVVKPFEVMDATSKGVLDANQVPVYWYGKSKVASLFGSGPINGMRRAPDDGMDLPGGGLLQRAAAEAQPQRGGLLRHADADPAAGLVQEADQDAAGLEGLKYRTVGLAADLLQEMGAKVTQLPGGEIVPAMERGVIDAFEFNNPTSDMRFGAQDVIKNYMMGSYPPGDGVLRDRLQQEEVRTRFRPDLQAILRYGVEAANSPNYGLAMDNYSRDLQES